MCEYIVVVDSTKKTNAQIIIMLGLVPTMTFVRFLDILSIFIRKKKTFHLDIVIAWTEKKEFGW